MVKRLVIAGTGSGVGKTTITIGLMAALKQRGLTVQGFKCGPDYVDPTYHTAVTGRPSRNLDSWMLTEETVQSIFARGVQGADIAIIEGVMGLYDGRDPASDEGSTAHISSMIDSSVLLVVNCASMARSAAAMVKGFQQFSDQVHIAGVIANQVGSEGHFQLVKTAIEKECHIPVIGYVKRELDIEIPERSHGLIPSVERGELQPFFNRLGSLITETIDLEQLLQIAKKEPTVHEIKLPEQQVSKKVTIAVAKDLAFHSYYIENFELLESKGAQLRFFSPLANEPVPEDADGLYLGGTLPEEFVHQLTANKQALQSIQQSIKNGLPTFAEGGGFMCLASEIETTNGESFPMAGIVPGKIQLHKKLAALGYREVKAFGDNFLIKQGETARGHEFHYATFEPFDKVKPAYQTVGMRGMKEDGFVTKKLVAGFTQIHFASNEKIVRNFIHTCMTNKEREE